MKVVGRFHKGKQTARLEASGYAQFFDALGHPTIVMRYKSEAEARATLAKANWREYGKEDGMDLDEILGKHKKHERFIKNTPTSKDRNIRLEVNGAVSESEKHFLNGMAFFMAGTLSKQDEQYNKYVSELMSKIAKHLIAKLKGSGDKP